MIKAEGVSFQYRKKKKVLDNINAAFEKGEVVGIVGPNGSGKTTTLKLFSRMIFPQKGNITLSGTVRAMLEQPSFYEDLCGIDNLEYFLKRTITEQEIQEAPFQCAEYVRTPVKRYSMGMRQKLALWMMFLSDADILLLDEPTVALDVDALAELEVLIRREKEHRCIVISSHDFNELQRMADRVVIISQKTFAREILIHGEESEKYRIGMLRPIPEEVMTYLREHGMTDSDMPEFFANKQKVAETVRQLTELGADIYEVSRISSFIENCYLDTVKKEEQ